MNEFDTLKKYCIQADPGLGAEPPLRIFIEPTNISTIFEPLEIKYVWLIEGNDFVKISLINI